MVHRRVDAETGDSAPEDGGRGWRAPPGGAGGRGHRRR
ncbi:hypothetical protein SLNHY_4655 [Streptomyces albus]|nr:hypothetical protein SLNHY_4655 [Streptomyces albus]